MSEPRSGYISEIFPSIQGEGTWVGYYQLFVRMAGCTAACVYCDAKEARRVRPSLAFIRDPLAKTVQTHANPVRAHELEKWITRIWAGQGPFHSVALTGGEPMEQAAFVQALVEHLRRRTRGIRFMLETNALHPDAWKRHPLRVDFIAADIKLPSLCPDASWILHERFLRLTAGLTGCAKVVCSPRSDPKEILAASRLLEKNAPAWELILQPATNYAWTPAAKQRLVRLLPQLQRRHRHTRLLPQVHALWGIH